jgi:hypothetical protein
MSSLASFPHGERDGELFSFSKLMRSLNLWDPVGIISYTKSSPLQNPYRGVIYHALKGAMNCAPTKLIN